MSDDEPPLGVEVECDHRTQAIGRVKFLSSKTFGQNKTIHLQDETIHIRDWVAHMRDRNILKVD